jgi:hypothetical protein
MTNDIQHARSFFGVESFFILRLASRRRTIQPMRNSPHDFNRYLGQVLVHVADDLKADAAKHGYLVNVLDPEAPRDIDREADRLDVIVDAEFKIRDIHVG